MELIKNTKIDFISKRYMAFMLSGILIAAGLASLVIKGGPNLGIDFIGGTLVQLEFKEVVQLDSIRTALSGAGIANLEMQSLQGNNVIIRAKKSDISESDFAKKLSDTLKEKLPQFQFEVSRIEYVGPAIGRHLFKQALMAIVFSMLGIIVYVAFRFHSGIWGLAGVVALAHDVFIVLGVFSMLDKEITLTIIAALLTLAGFSINDTIVVFDRMRENLRLLVKDNFGAVINKSVNQTLSRTIITSLTVFVVSFTLFFFGGEVIHDFAFAMLIGLVVGTYSSVFVAAPVVFEWEEYKKRKVLAEKGVK